MMKLKSALVMVMFAGISVFAQEIKIKKGDLLLDEKVVAKVDDKGRLYKFNDLNGELQFSATIINGRTNGTQTDKGWVEFTGPNGIVKEVESKGTSLGMGKFIVQTAMANGIMTKDGFDKAKIDEFFQTENRSFSQAREGGIAAQKAEADKEDAIAIDINSQGEILYNGGREIIGYITRVSVDASATTFKSKNPMDKFLEYKVFDVNRALVGKLPCSESDLTNEQTGMKIYTNDNKEIPMAQKNGSRFTTTLAVDDVAKRMIRKLFVNGYLSSKNN